MTDSNDDDKPEDDAAWGLVVPFLDTDQRFAYGVEFGMWYQSCRLKPEHGQYVRTENESQMTLTCARLKWDVAECVPAEGGWVWLLVRNPAPVEELT